MRKVAVSLFLLLCAACLAFAQEEQNKPPLSPPGTAEYTFADGKKITVAYSRPSMRGRKIMGELVPYGKTWRTGANAATTLTTDADLMIGGTKVPAGKYSLFTMPGENEWKLIINKQTGQGGMQYDAAQDFATVPMDKKSLNAPVEQFTISFDKTGGDSGKMKLEWETTSVSVDVKESK